MALWKEFKEFAVRGNVVDMAVGVVVGGAFGKIVTSLVNDVIMPLIGVATGGIDFKDKTWVMGSAPAPGLPPPSLNYGMFATHVVNFLLIAFSIFLAVKALNRLTRRPPPTLPPAATPPPEQEAS